MPLAPEQLEARVRRFYEEVFINGNLDVFDELVHPDFYSHTSPNETTRASTRAWFGRIIAEYPVVAGGPQDVVVQGNTIALRQEYVLRAAIDSEPTIARTMDFYKATEDGLLKEHWDMVDLVAGELPE
ncbi:MAG: nuclear transport factor 2 family protein [Acidimicrobiales bacterium]|nr:nuclear transport factor 2 family protein [Acidimicrobiales bacterium]RZV47236.1 MAG: hypothetical protein EX269_05290 [Acidimicrobiales bacterium]